MAKKVFFSFHYQDVSDFRVNVVRNHWLTKPDRQSAGYFDKSVWEKAEAQSDLGLKRLINGALSGCSTTCVLVGTQTYGRRWVQYEIMKSFRDGKKIIGVHINSIKDKNQNVKIKGANPFNYLGVTYSASGLTATLKVQRGGKWYDYTDVDGKASYQTGGVPTTMNGQGYNLSHFCTVHDWVSDNGYNNFGTWVA